MLRDAGLPMPAGRIARSADEAAAHAAALGFPVVMKVVSAQIAHKTEAGGVRLGIASENAARQAHAAIHEAVARHRPDARIDGVLVERMLPPGGREVLIGVHRDAAFGLVMTFGLGGIYVETLRDVAHRMIPLSPEDARALTREIRHVEILDGVRGQAPADFAALEALILRVSDFAWQHRDTLHELELNPVWVGAAGQGAVPLDARSPSRARRGPTDHYREHHGLSLDSTQTELLDSLRRYLNAEVAPIVDRYEAEGHMVPQEMLRAMRDFGSLGGMLPERDGGYGLPATTYGMLIAEVARVWPALRSIVSTSNLAASVLTDGGSPELKEKYLPRILSGEAIASFALSEPNIGSDAANIETRADETATGCASTAASSISAWGRSASWAWCSYGRGAVTARKACPACCSSAAWPAFRPARSPRWAC